MTVRSRHEWAWDARGRARRRPDWRADAVGDHGPARVGRAAHRARTRGPARGAPHYEHPRAPAGPRRARRRRGCACGAGGCSGRVDRPARRQHAARPPARGVPRRPLGRRARGWPVLLLVPALPSAGRVTVGGVHLFERDGRRTPLHETEFAHDGVFAYTSSRLLEWAEERSGGLFRAGDGRELSLEELRSDGHGHCGRGAAGAFERRADRARSFRTPRPSTTSRRSRPAGAVRWRRASTSSCAARRPSRVCSPGLPPSG